MYITRDGTTYSRWPFEQWCQWSSFSRVVWNSTIHSLLIEGKKKKHLLFWFCFVLSFIRGLIWNSWAVARPWLTMMRRLTVDYLLHNGTPLIWGNKDSFTPDFLWKKRGKKGKGNLWWEGNVNNFIHFVKLEIQQRQKHPGAVSTIMGRGEKLIRAKVIN